LRARNVDLEHVGCLDIDRDAFDRRREASQAAFHRQLRAHEIEFVALPSNARFQAEIDRPEGEPRQARCSRDSGSDAGRPCSPRSHYSPESRWHQGSRHIFGWLIRYLIESDSLR
jgi:hypothetical protein